MSDMTNYLEKKLLDHVLRNTVYTPPAVIYLALFTGAPGEAGGGTEVSGGSYARDNVNFTAADTELGTTSNNDALLFSNMPACTVVAFALMDALTAGNALWTKVLSTPRVVGAGDNLTVAAGELVVVMG